jgi:hypothetical protein
MDSVYVYCILRGQPERTMRDVVAVGGGRPVQVVASGDLSAVVSAIGQPAVETSRANLIAHQRVLERVQAEMPLLPVRFGTVTPPCDGPALVRGLLADRHDEFARLLGDVEARVELGLKALWADEEAVFAEIAAGSRSIQVLRDRLWDQPARAGQMERVRLGRLVKEALDRRRAALANRILSPLRAVATRVVENPVLLDRMIVNAAFLVERDRGAEFDRRVRELDRELAPGVSLRYVGPVPPYNFVQVTVEWGRPVGSGRWA